MGWQRSMSQSWQIWAQKRSVVSPFFHVNAFAVTKSPVLPLIIWGFELVGLIFVPYNQQPGILTAVVQRVVVKQFPTITTHHWQMFFHYSSRKLRWNPKTVGLVQMISLFKTGDFQLPAALVDSTSKTRYSWMRWHTYSLAWKLLVLGDLGPGFWIRRAPGWM